MTTHNRYMSYPRILKLVAIFLISFLAKDAVYGQDNNHTKALDRIEQLLFESKYELAISEIDRFEQINGELTFFLNNKKALALIQLGLLYEAEIQIENLKSLLPNLDQKQLNTALLKCTIAYLNMNKGRSDIALDSLEEAIPILMKEENGLETANALSLLANTLVVVGNYSKAVEQLQLALAIRKEKAPNNVSLIAASYNDLGLAYLEIDANKALDYYEMALGAYSSLYRQDHPKIAVINTNLGIAYLSQNLYGDAIIHFERALKVWESIYPNPHPSQAIVLTNLGRSYLGVKKPQSATKFIQQAIDIYSMHFGTKSPDLAYAFNLLGNVYVSKNDIDSAMMCYQKAMIANVPNFNTMDSRINPATSGYYNARALMYSFLYKAKALEIRYATMTLSLNDLKFAIKCLHSCDTLIDNLRHQSSNESDKLSLGELATELYEDGVRIALEITDVVLDKRKYINEAFYFAEKSKSAVLQESIADTQAKSFSGIPAALLEEEKNLKAAISFLSQKLSGKPNAEEEKYLRETLFQLNIDYANFIKRLESEFPNYYNLKFNSTAPTIAELQSSLKEQQAIISYFVAEKTGRLYQFILTGNAFRIRNLALPTDFERLAKGWMNSLYYRSFDAYSQTADRLRKLLVPPLPARITEVTLLPAGRLATLPFEALPIKKVKGDFASQSFLATRYGISYEFSAGLLLQKAKVQGKQNSKSIFLCAPVEFTNNNGLGFLPGSEIEVNTISLLFGNQSDVVTHTQASETTIKQTDLSQYKYLHFATHGIVDERNPELSRIFLNTDNHEDGNLYAGEIYNLSLSADLAVLSACQTGLGKVSKGEGVIGLSRALVYAGAKNLVVSFWSVADESTTQLMTDFYRFLLADPGGNYKIALQKAKQKMIQEKHFADPYFWAPFILIGN